MTQEADVENKRLYEWFNNFITYFRNEYEKLSDEEKKFVGADVNYLPPCQVEVFWIKDPAFQLIVKTNFPDRDDMEVIVNGPYDASDFIDKVDSVMKQPRWSRTVERSDFILYAKDVYYAEILASHLSILGFLNS